MKQINLPKASALTSPNPVTLVCTQKPDGSTNLATVSWWTYLSFNPSMIAYAILNMENHLNNDELFRLMQARMG